MKPTPSLRKRMERLLRRIEKTRILWEKLAEKNDCGEALSSAASYEEIEILLGKELSRKTRTKRNKKI